ncbi:MAG: TPM domain-containing protein [Luteolibacter sp.]
MMKHAVILLLVSFLASMPARADEPAFEYGPRPENSIYDPEQSLSPETAKRLADELTGIRTRDRADVMIVLLPGIGELPPEHVARRFDEAWGKDVLHAVVLDVAGRNDGPWILVGGEVTNSDRKDVIPRMTKSALRLARQEPDRESCLRSAAVQTSDILRYMKGKVKSQMEAYQSERMKVRLDMQRSLERKRIFLIAAICSLVPVTGTLFLIGSVIWRCRARRFPEVIWSRRLGAPYTGGNNATVDLGSSRSSS